MEQLRKIVSLVGDVLGPEVIGTYLYGSSVLGGLRPASDVDVLVVARRSMDERERRALVESLLAVSGSVNRARPVELNVVARPEVVPWRFPPVGDFLYGEWLRGEFEAGVVPQPVPMPDLAVTITSVLAGDRPITGPAPARVLAPVPHADLIRASLTGVPDLLGNLDGDTRNVLLTLARIWCTLATAEIRTKDAAADWALARLPSEHRPVLVHARDLYVRCRYSEECWSDELREQVRPHADAVLARIDRLSRR